MPFGIEADLFDYPLDQGDLVVAVVNHVVRAVAGAFGFAAQVAGAGGVEGANLQAAQAVAQQRFNARAHFAGGFVGEGDRHDAMMGYAMLAYQPGDAARQHTGFAAARSSQHQHGSIAGCDGGALLWVHALKQRILAHATVLPGASIHCIRKFEL